jgi:hypothetical protein
MPNTPPTTHEDATISHSGNCTWVGPVVVGAVVTLLSYGLAYVYLAETGHPKEAQALLRFPPNLVRSVALAIRAGSPRCLIERQAEQAASLPKIRGTSPGRPKGPVPGEKTTKGHKRSINPRKSEDKPNGNR